MNHEAIYRAYPNVISIDDSTGAFDVDGNSVTLVQSVIDSAAAEVSSEQSLATLRTKRNKLLAETDYFALSDVTMSDEMKTYRQSLRDLPSNTSDAYNPVWPTKPEGQ